MFQTQSHQMCVPFPSFSSFFSFLESAVEGDKLTIESKPTLPYFIQQGLITKIAPKYPDFGVLLLDDEDGSIVDSIEMKCKENPHAITREILKRWLQGRGKGPVTYATHVKVLKQIELGVLAQSIETALR